MLILIKRLQRFTLESTLMGKSVKIVKITINAPSVLRLLNLLRMNFGFEECVERGVDKCFRYSCNVYDIYN